MAWDRRPFIPDQRLADRSVDELLAYKSHLLGKVVRIKALLDNREGALAEGKRGFWSSAAKAVAGAALAVAPLVMFPIDFGLSAAIITAAGGALNLDGLLQVLDRLKRNNELGEEAAWAETNLLRIAQELQRIDQRLP